MNPFFALSGSIEVLEIVRASKSEDRNMPKGTLEVLLVSAQGLENTDFLCQMDPYCLIKCRTQQQKSSVASNAGRSPEWNEKFVFNVSEGVSDLVIRIMDKDTFSADDFVGEASIPLDGVFEAGSLPPSAYNVVLADYTYCGQIKVGLNFIPKTEEELGGPCDEEEDDLGGWKEGYL